MLAVRMLLALIAAAPLLATMQRTGGDVATLDLLTVRADGTARLDKRYGGAGRRQQTFRLRAATMRRVRSGLRRLPARSPGAVRHGRSAGPDVFLLRARGRTLVVSRAQLRSRRLGVFRLLDEVIDGSGRADRR